MEHPWNTRGTRRTLGVYIAVLDRATKTRGTPVEQPLGRRRYGKPGARPAMWHAFAAGHQFESRSDMVLHFSKPITGSSPGSAKKFPSGMGSNPGLGAIFF